MTVGEMTERMSARELREWQIFDHLEYRDSERRRKKAARDAKQAAERD